MINVIISTLLLLVFASRVTTSSPVSVCVCTDNATRFCQPDAAWNNHTNYDRCEHILPQHIAVQGPSAFDFNPAIEVSTYIYVGGFALSLVSLVLAVLVFINFK